MVGAPAELSSSNANSHSPSNPARWRAHIKTAGGRDAEIQSSALQRVQKAVQIRHPKESAGHAI